MTARKHWFKVPDAVLFEDWSDEQLAILIRLQAYLNVQWARGGKDDSERGTAVLRPAEMTLVTGRKRTDNAVVALRKLAGISDLTIEFPNGNAVISWPKYAEFQKSQTDKRPGKGHSDSDSDSDSDSGSKKPEKRERAPSAPAANAAPRSPRRALVEKPESFPPDSKERLREWAERKGYDRSLLNAGLDAFRDWVPQKPPYRRTLEQWEGAFKKILREGVADGKFGKSETKPRAAYRRDDSGQVLVPNEWRGLAG